MMQLASRSGASHKRLPRITMIAVVAEYSTRSRRQEILTVVESNTVHMPCHTELDEPVDWMVRVAQGKFGKQYHVIYASEGLRKHFKHQGRFAVTTDGRFYNLTIAKVKLSDAGEYFCFEHKGFKSKPSANYLLRVVTGE